MYKRFLITTLFLRLTACASTAVNRVNFSKSERNIMRYIITIITFICFNMMMGCMAESPPPTVPPCAETAGTLTTVRIPDDDENEHIARKTRVYLPPCYGQSAQTYPVLYLIHGAGLNGSTWFDPLDAADIMDRRITDGTFAPFIIIAPTLRGEKNDIASRYIGGPTGISSDEVWFVDHLQPTVDDLYQTHPDRLYRGIAGMSMGGGFSGRIGWRNPELFGALGLYATTSPVKIGTELAPLLDSIPPDLSQHIYLDVGRLDGLFKTSEQVVRYLEEADMMHTYVVGEGGHTLTYWEKNMETYLAWFDTVWGVPIEN